MAIVSTDIHQIAIAFAGGGQFWENILHFYNSVTASTTPEQDSVDLCTQVNTTLKNKFLACLSPDVTLIGYRAKRVNSTGGPSAVLPAAAGSVGLLTGTMSNTRDAAIFTTDYLNSLATIPHWRVGRMFLGGLMAQAMEDDTWTAGFLTPATALATQLNAGVGSTTPGPWLTCVWSPTYRQGYISGSWELAPQMGSLGRRVKPHL